MSKEICPICDGFGINFIELNQKVDCWACKGRGEVVYKEETYVSEKEIKTMYSVLEQR